MTKPKQNTPSDNLRESLLMVLRSEIISVERQNILLEGKFVAATDVDKDLKNYLERIKSLHTNIERFEM